MLKMKLPQKKTKHKTPEEEGEDGESILPTDVPRGCPPTGLHREAVYEWFVQSLGPAQRLELACGLLDLCNPLELRFLGSCLEDLGRKDCHYLRDCETRANGLGGELQQLLGDLGDPTSRSRLIVYLALLHSDNREVAGRLYRLLLLPGAGLERLLGGWEQEEDEEVRDAGDVAAAREELLLLFTMASMHPAFSFHQRLTLREKMEQLRETIHRTSRPQERVHEYLPSNENHLVENTVTHNGVVRSRKLQREAVYIEKITLKGAQRKRSDKNLEYTFKVTWSDLSVTSVTKSHQDLLDFLLMLPKELSSETFDKTILRALNLGSQKREERRYTDLEPIVRQIFSSPSQALLQNQRVHTFFLESVETSHPYNNLPATPKSCNSPQLFKEDSSEASSQEEDVQQHMTIHKKPAGKCPTSNTQASKTCPLSRLHMPHCEQNGGNNWRKKNGPGSPHHEHYKNSGHQHTTDKGRPYAAGQESTSERNTMENVEAKSICRTNGVKPAHIMRSSVGKEPALEVGSGHETCGETSSESYSSPSSPRHDRRESFESEDEKDRDTDSNSEDSSKHGVPGFTTFGTIDTSVTKLSAPLGNNNESLLDDPMSISKFPHVPFLSAIPCMMHHGPEKLESGISPTIPTDGKALGTLVSPVSMSPLREAYHPCSLGLASVPAIRESEKRMDMLTSSVHVPSPFISRNCQPSNPPLHLPVQRLKMPSPAQSETNTLTGSTQIGLGLGSANSGFISVHSPGAFPASPVTVSGPLSKTVSQVVGLNQVVPHLDGNASAMPPPTNLKLVLPATNLSPAPPSVPYPLSGANLAAGVLPTNTSVLNAAVTVASSQPANVAIGQVQAAIPPAVPTHTPGPAPCPSPALTHSTAQSDGTSFISAAVANNSTNGALVPPQQMGPGACGSCGRRCSCANSGMPPMSSYYYANQVHGQVYRVPPFFPLPSICNGTYLNQAHQSNGTHLPFFLHQAPYTNGLIHDPVLGGQANYGMQQIPSFARYYSMYPSPNVVANGSGPKKNGNISCFNCGITGHVAQDCKQPPMDANQQGIYRLRFASPLPPSHDTLDSAD
ncbi:zinc finger CCHC domain-containing protein 2 [Pelodytes ibericus]